MIGYRVWAQKDPQQAAHQEAEKDVYRCFQEKIPSLDKYRRNDVYRLHVPDEVSLLSDMLQADLQQIRHVLIIQRVIEDRTLSAVSNEGQILEPAELVRDG